MSRKQGFAVGDWVLLVGAGSWYCSRHDHGDIVLPDRATGRVVGPSPVYNRDYDLDVLDPATGELHTLPGMQEDWLVPGPGPRTPGEAAQWLIACLSQ